MNNIIKLEDLNEATKLSIEEIITIVEEYIDKLPNEYDINKKSILFDKEFYVDQTRVCYIDIIAIKNKTKWPDAYETLVISDNNGTINYVLNDHGVVIMKY